MSIKSLSDQKLKQIKKLKKKIVLCHGVFDLFHVGHLSHINEAKKLGDVLIVSVTTDKFVNKGPDRPYFNTTQRMTLLSAIRDIDFVISSDSPSSIGVIEKIRPNIYFKGPDYLKHEDDFTGFIKKEISAVKKSRITKKTRLIQLTHVGGEPVKDIEEITKFAKKNKIYLLEDCSQAIGAMINGKYVGSFGDISAFSTMYRKNLAANSSSGIVFTKNYNLFKKVLAYADRGKILWNENLDLRDPKHSLFPALNWNTDEFSCAMGLANLKRLKKTNNNRVIFVKKLINLFKKKNINSCKIENFHNGYSPFYLPITYNKNILKISKKNFGKHLSDEGIPIGINYGCVVSEWKWAKKYLKPKFKTFNAIEFRDNCFHLYLNENYKNNEAKDIVDAIAKIEKFYEKKKNSFIRKVYKKKIS